MNEQETFKIYTDTRHNHSSRGHLYEVSNFGLEYWLDDGWVYGRTFHKRTSKKS